MIPLIYHKIIEKGAEHVEGMIIFIHQSCHLFYSSTWSIPEASVVLVHVSDCRYITGGGSRASRFRDFPPSSHQIPTDHDLDAQFPSPPCVSTSHISSGPASRQDAEYCFWLWISLIPYVPSSSLYTPSCMLSLEPECPEHHHSSNISLCKAGKYLLSSLQSKMYVTL